MITALLLVLAQAAAATPAPAPSPAPAAKLGGGFGQPGQAVTAKAKAKTVITDATLAPAARRGTFSVAGARSAPGATPTPGAPPPPKIVDDETAWRDRVTRLRAELVTAEKDYDVADANNTVVSFGSGSGWEYQQMMAARNAALTPYRLRLAEIRRELMGLPDECRKTQGCQPGWVR